MIVLLTTFGTCETCFFGWFYGWLILRNLWFCAL